ncbi:MAG: hypothetical protein IIZ90_00290 [Bacteroidales bacterium]|nr:hypothetical protein [Bacteroidales bacterium]
MTFYSLFNPQLKKGTSSYPVDPDAPIERDIELLIAINKSNIKRILR